MPHALVTIPISHYCERARWALDRARVPYVERRYPPLFHVAPARALGPTRTLPKLALEGGRVLTDSDEIVAYADELLSGALSAGRTNELVELEARLAKRLGPAVRRWLYHTLLDHPSMTRPLLAHGCGTAQRGAFYVLSPAILPLMRKGMRIDARSAARDRDTVHAILDDVADVLSDGRAYLHGRTFGTADLTFASLAAPLTYVDDYGVPLRRIHELPEPLASELGALQDHPALAHVRTCYRVERR